VLAVIAGTPHFPADLEGGFDFRGRSFSSRRRSKLASPYYA
jgi:hypothetical protein